MVSVGTASLSAHVTGKHPEMIQPQMSIAVFQRALPKQGASQSRPMDHSLPTHGLDDN